jgi:hypothetical protein
MSCQILTDLSDPASNIQKQTGEKQPSFDASSNTRTKRSQARRTRPTTPTGNTNDNVRFATVTINNFEKFQKIIFPVIGSITSKKEFADHPFTALWKQGLQHHLHLSDNTTLRTIQKILPVENLQEYWHFLLECPELEKYIWFHDSPHGKAGFEYHVHKIPTASTTTDKTSQPYPDSDATTLEKDNPPEPSGDESYELLKDLSSNEITSDDSGTSNNTSEGQF